MYRRPAIVTRPYDQSKKCWTLTRESHCVILRMVTFTSVSRVLSTRIFSDSSWSVSIRKGYAVRRHKVVKSDNPEDLVFQSVRAGAPMRDNNVFSRHIKPAPRKMGLAFVNWRCFRTSHTWLTMAGADVRDAQGQMRHSRASMTLLCLGCRRRDISTVDWSPTVRPHSPFLKTLKDEPDAQHDKHCVDDRNDWVVGCRVSVPFPIRLQPLKATSLRAQSICSSRAAAANLN
jgi:hypothetical protein